MNYLIDTNVLIDFFHGKENVAKKLKLLEEKKLTISAITSSEIYRGAYKTKIAEKHIKDFENFLADFSINVLPINESVAKKYGWLMSYLEKKGVRPSAFDVLIAATAIIYNLTLLTEDKGFLNMEGGKVEYL